MKRLIVVMGLAAAGCGGGPKAGSATAPVTAPSKRLVNVDADGVGLGGYDPLAYRTAGKPVAGLPEHTVEHDGVKYHFSSDESASKFNGATDAPQFGGYCAFAASQGRLSPADPLVFEIYEGQLLVFTNTDFRDQFDQDRAGNKAKADAAWPQLVAKYGK